MHELITLPAKEVLQEPKAAKLEINLLKSPFFVLAKQQLRELLQKTVSTKKSQVGYADEATGESWWVNPSAVLGYAGPFDKKVFVTVQQVIIEQGLPLKSPLVPLDSLRGLCERMQLSESGKNKKLVKDALMRIAGAEIYTENTFFLREDKRFWKSKGKTGGYFHIWDVFWKGDVLPDGRYAECVYLLLNAPFIQSLNSYYLKPIDYDYYMSLESPLAQRLYEILGLKFYGLKDSPYVKYHYSRLCLLLPMTKQEFLSLAKQQLHSSCAKLKKTGFLEKVEWVDLDGKDWWLFFYPGPRAREEIAKAKEQPALAAPNKQRGLFLDNEEEIMVEGLVYDILAVIGDEHSRPFYLKLARMAVRKGRLYDLIYQCISEVKYESSQGLIRQSKGAAFTDKIKRYSKEYGIELGLKGSERREGI